MATKKFEISKSESVRLLIKTCFENKVTQHAQIACVLANCQHETLNFLYSEEVDGRRQAKLLGYRGGIEYYGRGYIHLTHIDNYQKADNKLGLGGKLIRNLDYATDPNIAAKIAVIGMRDGWFTGLGLKRWIDGDKGWITGDGLSYYYARQIVNGDFKTTNTSEIAEEWSSKIPSIVNDIDGYSVLSVSLVDIKEASVSDSLIEITVAEDSSFSQKYTTNKEGIIPYIYTPLNATLEFKIDNRTCHNKLVMDKKFKSITLVDSNCNFNTETQPHKVVDNTNEQKTNELDQGNTASNKLNETEKGNNSRVDSVTFNIQLVEADTGKPLPNTTYHLEYKNNINPHKTDTTGIDANIKADVDQSIGVLLDDDNNKKQSIYSMAFPVTTNLNGQTKVLKVPVVSLNIRFLDENNNVIPNYAFKTIYRNKESGMRKANSQGITQLKALAGQKITIIDANSGAKTSGIVTDGALKWTIRINSSVLEETKISNKTPDVVKDEDSLAGENSSTNNNTPELQVEKPKIKEKEVITSQGPTHEVESDETLFTIKFLDESTNKPISGLTYYTKSTNYGKKPSVTGSDGTRGRPHESLIGVEITVLVYEDGKEVEKGRFTVSHDRDEPYVYKAKKPDQTWHNPLKKMELRGWYSNTQWSPEKSDYKGRTGGKHDGLDLYAPLGTTLYACVSGTIYEDYISGTYGRTIGIKGEYKGKTYYFFYAHLSDRKFKKDDIVTVGQEIGKTGNTGNVDKGLIKGYHLHFELRTTPNRTGGRINPYTIEELKTINKSPSKSSQR